MRDVVWLSVDKAIPPDSYWDQTLLKELLKPCNHHYAIGDLKQAIVIIPGAYMGKHIDAINAELSKLEKCKVIITSDEENNFPIDGLLHNNMEVYATYFTDRYTRDIRWLPIGPAKIPNVEYNPKTLNWFYAGQVNHDSRKQLVEVLQNIPDGELLVTAGFAKGLEQSEYYKKMAQAKAVPAPKGNISPDSFRFYEALELGAVPIAENIEFWNKLFPDNDLPIVEQWNDIEGFIDYISKNQEYRNRCVAWWIQKKIEIQQELIGQTDNVTVVLPISAVKSHPDTVIVDETIKSIRTQLPNATIIATFDGVREEKKDKYNDYQEFIERFLRKYGNANIYPIIFTDHTHQVGMMRESMKHIKTKFIVYVEQDTPFTDDYIDWKGCKIALDTVDLIRFHFETQIPEPHKYLMRGKIQNKAVPLIRTRQWSQRPHITTKIFYDRVLQNFSPNAISFIEDKMHSVAQEQPRQYRLSIYNPKGSIKRTYHTDGRAGEEKYDDKQIF